MPPLPISIRSLGFATALPRPSLRPAAITNQQEEQTMKNDNQQLARLVQHLSPGASLLVVGGICLLAGIICLDTDDKRKPITSPPIARAKRRRVFVTPAPQGAVMPPPPPLPRTQTEPSTIPLLSPKDWHDILSRLRALRCSTPGCLLDPGHVSPCWASFNPPKAAA
jgi:hypothetical protein